MGSPLQQILPGRGDKKGKGFRLKAFAIALVVAAWVCLLLHAPLRVPVFWFPFTAAVLVFCGLLHVFSGRREYALEFLFIILLFFAGIIEITGLSWLKFSYFPFIIALTGFYPLRIVVPLSVLVPFTGLRAVAVTQGNVIGEAAFSLSLVATSVVAASLFRQLRSEKEEAAAELEKIRAGARDRTQDIEMESLGSDEIISHYFASRIRTNEEIRELLHAIKHAVFADGAHFFEQRGEVFSLRCSTGDREKVMITGRKRIMAFCLRERRPFFSGEVNDRTDEIGYARDIKILSLIAMPVMEGPTPVGLLAVDSARYHAFNEPEQKTVQMFSAQIARILERERIYTIIRQDITALRIIKEFSANIAASIHYDDIVQKLSESAEKAFSGKAFFLEHDQQGFRVRLFPGEVTGALNQDDLAGTLVRFAADSRQKQYVSDARQYGMKVFPQQFRTEPFRSVIAVPLFHEDGLLGVFGMIAKQKEFLDSRQINLVEVMCNQALTSIANARMHAEIERLAATDGLTELYNHRVFQQKLTEELKRSDRYETPLSLLLLDIDHFKKVNDTYGHPAGDLVIRGIARILKEGIREIDIGARYGGEEFAVILPGTDSKGARYTAERLRTAVMAATFSVDGKSLKVTASIGIASVPDDARTKEDLIERTDEALYRAKHHGRNQTVCWAAAL